ncbi:maltokinase N-terminal cap-like domain-containing protein [Aeromicrobium sp. Sec7.5]|uniref:maltokinase N-terminal cap-like domain-containing protein n=1 Tax=Aeromicrobium sp. Sec7.5 TaxID=3121276 RepID=UPI002FE4A258
MGIVHPGSELTPTKQELLAAWLPTQPWWPTGAEVPKVEASFRFDDPAGEVGIETFLLRVGGGIVHVPLTYRSAPWDGGELIGELEHSALGHRWVYLATSDPVYVAETTAVIRDGRGEVAMVGPDGSEVPRRRSTASVRGSGAGSGQLRVALAIAPDEPVPAASGTLTATWPGQPTPVTLALLAED